MFSGQYPTIFTFSELQEKHEAISAKIEVLKQKIAVVKSFSLEDLADKLIQRVRSFVEDSMSGKLQYLNVRTILHITYC